MTFRCQMIDTRRSIIFNRLADLLSKSAEHFLVLRFEDLLLFSTLHYYKLNISRFWCSVVEQNLRIGDVNL